MRVDAIGSSLRNSMAIQDVADFATDFYNGSQWLKKHSQPFLAISNPSSLVVLCAGKLVSPVFFCHSFYAVAMKKRQLYIAAYDISDSKRLRHALYAVRAYASGGQKSVFECFLTVREKQALLEEIQGIIDPYEDRFLLLKLDVRCRVRTLGKAVSPQDGSFYYIG